MTIASLENWDPTLFSLSPSPFIRSVSAIFSAHLALPEKILVLPLLTLCDLSERRAKRLQKSF
jgi:hypothetical protein